MQEALVALQARSIPVIFVSDQGADELNYASDGVGHARAVRLRARRRPCALRILRGPIVHRMGDDEYRRTAQRRRHAQGTIPSATPSVLVVGFGSDWSDLDVLTEVDAPVIVRRKDGGQQCLERELPTAYVTHETGAAGWREAVLGWES